MQVETLHSFRQFHYKVSLIFILYHVMINVFITHKKSYQKKNPLLFNHEMRCYLLDLCAC